MITPGAFYSKNTKTPRKEKTGSSGGKEEKEVTHYHDSPKPAIMH